jgi:hypothetical protein
VTLAKAAQRLHDFGFAGATHLLSNIPCKPVFGRALEQLTPSNQLVKKFRTALARSRNELAARPYAGQRCAHSLVIQKIRTHARSLRELFRFDGAGRRRVGSNLLRCIFVSSVQERTC